MITFIGEFNLKIDAKGRLVFPSAFKKQVDTSLPGQFVVKEDLFEKCLVLYPMEEWERQNTIIRKKLNPFNRKHNLFIRGFAKGAAEVHLDNNSRLLIPKRLLEFAGIDKEVVLAGQNGKIEIWSRKNYEGLWGDDVDFAGLAEDIMDGDINFEE